MPERCGRPEPEQVAVYTLALQREAQELAEELGWKPWKKLPEINRERVLDEFADVLAFLGLIATYVASVTDATPEEIALAYMRKSEVNVARLTGEMPGYEPGDGLKGATGGRGAAG